MKWLDKHFRVVEDFPQPDWEAIYNDVEQYHNEEEKHDLWCNIARSWMNLLITALPANYAIHESDDFILVTSESEKYVSTFHAFLDHTQKKILNALPGIASDEGFGKYVVIIFDDIDRYYSYLSYYYHKDGVYGLSSGVYLNKGYGHFAFPQQELSYAECIAAHEMTHALLSHLPIPAWLNEGIAVGIENLIAGSSPLRMDNEMYAKHQSFWGKNEIQEFWSGEVFHRPDQGQELSYHLAQLAIHSLSQDYDTFIEFVNKAHFSDGGEAAANEVYDGSLGNLMVQYFGDGDWRPNPDAWSEIYSNE